MCWEFFPCETRGWDKSPSLSIVFWIVEQDAVVEWASTLISSAFTAPQLCGGGTTKSNSNELPISVPLSYYLKKTTSGFGVI